MGRAPLARTFTDHVLTLDDSQGVVVGVLGPWGGGKTSFVNLAVLRLEERGASVLAFNPWMFSGAEQLVQSFFRELAAEVRLKTSHSEIADILKDYGESFSGLGWPPVVGPWISRFVGGAKAIAALLERQKEGIAVKRQRLTNALRTLPRQLVVVLDDIDRLTTDEIQSVFKLVRLIANFPRITYILAFDRARVEAALTDSGVPGREYLEKILQVAVDLPAIPSDVLNKQVFAALDRALSDIDTGLPFNTEAWTDIYVEIVRPLIRHMRDVRRYAAAVRGTMLELQGQVATVDVLGLEAVRVFMPDVFAQLHQSVHGLTAISSHTSDREDETLKSQIETLLAVAGDRSQIVRALIIRIFPAAQRHIGNMHYGADWQAQWLRNRRVSHEDILRLYLERVAGESLLAFADAERAFRVMANGTTFDEFIRQLPPDRWQDVIGALEAFEREFRPAQVVPASTTLLNLLPDLPDRTRGMFDLSSRMVVTRVVYRLLKALENEQAIATAVREIVPQLRTLSARLEIIEMVGHTENRGHGLIAADAAKELEQQWIGDVRGTAADALAQEFDVFGIVLAVRRWQTSEEGQFELPASPELTRAILRAAKGDIISQSMGSRAVRRTPQLQWEALSKAYGSEELLKEHIQQLRSSGLDTETELLDLADKYASGWRPSRGMED